MIAEPRQPTPYEMIGGEEKLRAIVDRFYDLMELEPRYAQLRAVHGSTLEHAREKLFMFLSGWLGGPPLYTDRFGHPMLRARHLPFAIGTVERDQWMACMGQALEEMEVPEPFRLGLLGNLFKTADWMRNRPG
ncbi:MAG TPA: group II truncated hemoglobin [Usitatibacter sp.]|nr:group II truncated hemoglobin [Usitatibacter sp.]